MPEVAVSVASNLRPEVHVPLALEALGEAFDVRATSRFHETAPVGRPEQPDYWNGAVLLRTDLDPDALHGALRSIEHRLGRRRTEDRFAARTIDLDVLAWDGRVVDEDVATRPFLRWCLEDLDVLPTPRADDGGTAPAPDAGGTGHRVDTPRTPP